MFKNKILLITGGTGSFGNAVLRRFLSTDIAQIRVFSRDEKKQDDMRHRYPSDKLRFYIGDVRNIGSLQDALIGVDHVFGAAALKQVPSCEFYPMEAVRTNVIGTDNTLTAAIAAGVKECRPAEHRQSGLPDQRHGHVEGADGKGRHCPFCHGGPTGNHRVRHALWERDGLTRVRNSPVPQPDQGRPPADS